MKKKKALLISALIFGTISLIGCSKNAEENNPTVDETESIKLSTYSSLASVHDPSIIKVDDKYYIFGSHMDAAFSEDLFTWSSFATGVNSSNQLFTGLFDSAAFDWVGLNEDGGYSVWAPDVIYNEAMQKYCMYFCTTSDWNTSTICMAVSDNIEGPYEYQTSLIDSGFTAANVADTNVDEILGYDGADRNYWTTDDYNSQEWPNALDPSVFYDADGRMWMVYGSWSGGIFILELDPTTGLVIHPEDDAVNGIDKYFGKHILAYGHTSCEAPYILYNEDNGYYYLFVSYGSLTSEGGYNIRVFRSENPDGPYTDAMGQEWLTSTDYHSKFGVKLMGNYMLPSLSKAYMAPGHNSAMIDDDGKMYLVYHTRFDDGQEYHQPRVHQMFTNEDGWLVVAPFAYNTINDYDETVSEDGYSQDEIVGTYHYLTHMIDTSYIIHDTEEIQLNSDGTISGSVTGTWEEKDGSYYANITIDGILYKGVFLKQQDESYQEVMTFTCVSDENNICIWGIKYY